MCRAYDHSPVFMTGFAAIRIFLSESWGEIAITLLPAFFSSMAPARRSAIPITITVTIAVMASMMTIAIPIIITIPRFFAVVAIMALAMVLIKSQRRT
jgi:hypothetical protein